jgi:hypothetical protein
MIFARGVGLYHGNGCNLMKNKDSYWESTVGGRPSERLRNGTVTGMIFAGVASSR